VYNGWLHATLITGVLFHCKTLMSLHLQNLVKERKLIENREKEEREREREKIKLK